MFGYVTANWQELTKEQQVRYSGIYCGICRRIREQASGTARLALSYDMAFLALLLMSLYEPEETSGRDGCILHPFRHRPWTDSEIIRYTADMNVALAYYNALDDWQDDGSLPARLLARSLEPHCEQIAARWPRQWEAIGSCMEQLARLERENCANPDGPAGAFGSLMAEFLVYREDLWAPTLRQMGYALGRFIYLVDAAVDARKDSRSGSYNPLLAAQTPEREAEEYLVLAMGRAASFYEKLPLVQDKALLDNILYSGVWVKYRNFRKGEQNG